jgi:hypothetical protein
LLSWYKTGWNLKLHVPLNMNFLLRGLSKWEMKRIDGL